MAHEFETMREVAIAIEGIEKQLALYAKVFAGVVVIASAAYGALFYKIDNVEDVTARLETRMVAIENILSEIRGATNQTRADVLTMKTSLASPALAAEPSKDAFRGWLGVATSKPGDAEAVLRRYIDEADTTKPTWIFIPETDTPK